MSTISVSAVDLLPACAGMIPGCLAFSIIPFTAPRMRGDDPEYDLQMRATDACSPHARG